MKKIMNLALAGGILFTNMQTIHASHSFIDKRLLFDAQNDHLGTHDFADKLLLFGAQNDHLGTVERAMEMGAGNIIEALKAAPSGSTTDLYDNTGEVKRYLSRFLEINEIYQAKAKANQLE